MMSRGSGGQLFGCRWALLVVLTCHVPGELTASPAVCQGVTFVGCCQGVRLVWCDGTGLNSMDCSALAVPGNTCGWDASMGTYDCGGQGADPKGVHARTCPVVDLDASGDTGTEPGCKVGVLVQDGCDGVTFQGCCDAAGGLVFCESGARLCRLDCTTLRAPNNVCGWHTAGVSGYYDCGGGGPDPAGVQHRRDSCAGCDAGGFDHGCPVRRCPQRGLLRGKRAAVVRVRGGQGV